MSQYEIRIEGLVQGVGFRRFVQRQANALAITGYVKNQSDGSVYVLADTAEEIFDYFCRAIKLGNGYSQVENLSINTLDRTDKYYGFSIR